MSLRTQFEGKLAPLTECRQRSAEFRTRRGQAHRVAQQPREQARASARGSTARSRAQGLQRPREGLPALSQGVVATIPGDGQLTDWPETRAVLAAAELDLPAALHGQVARLGVRLDALDAARGLRDELFKTLCFFPATPRTDSLG